MKGLGTDIGGSFVAYGTGFVYDYSAPRRLLSICEAESQKLLLDIKSNKLQPENARTFATLLDKVTQITALTLSRRQTVDLTETITIDKIPALLEGSAILTNYAFDLHLNSFESFCNHFRRDYEFAEIIIDKAYGDNFEGFVQTRYGHKATANGDSITGLLQNMANSIVQDLITLEFSSKYGGSAQRLLNASSTLNLDARVLDNKFVPKHKIIGSRKPPEKITL